MIGGEESADEFLRLDVVQPAVAIEVRLVEALREHVAHMRVAARRRCPRELRPVDLSVAVVVEPEPIHDAAGGVVGNAVAHRA